MGVGAEEAISGEDIPRIASHIHVAIGGIIKREVLTLFCQGSAWWHASPKN